MRLELTETCWMCDGYKEISTKNPLNVKEKIKCPKCDGKGLNLTSDGIEVLDFLKLVKEFNL